MRGCPLSKVGSRLPYRVGAWMKGIPGRGNSACPGPVVTIQQVPHAQDAGDLVSQGLGRKKGVGGGGGRRG